MNRLYLRSTAGWGSKKEGEIGSRKQGRLINSFPRRKTQKEKELKKKDKKTVGYN